ncbi:MAG: glycosyltransferase [Candidatus Nanopelagicales bacterium]|nr:glycosyltransferase [Candidatus Nanopelagicales bacterium]MDZ4250378.1 glycosyltransferase [Candidatus Nanopelagicales bacterium]
MTGPLVSVITATHAGDDVRHLGEALDSVIAQGHRPIELLVVCDGPVPDDTREMLSQRARDNPWIRVYPLESPSGPAVARNSVLARCRGDFIAILDSDDAMSPTRVSAQIDYLTAHGLDVVASWLAVIDQSGAEQGVREFPVSWSAVRARVPYSCPTANTAVMFRREILPEFHYPEDIRVGEDYRLWVELIRRGRRIGNIPEPLTRYRTGADYFNRRRGLSYAKSDLATKLRALPLVVWWQRPVVVAVAGATFVVRLLPTALFRSVYRVFERVGRGGAA